MCPLINNIPFEERTYVKGDKYVWWLIRTCEYHDNYNLPFSMELRLWWIATHSACKMSLSKEKLHVLRYTEDLKGKYWFIASRWRCSRKSLCALNTLTIFVPCNIGDLNIFNYFKSALTYTIWMSFWVHKLADLCNVRNWATVVITKFYNTKKLVKLCRLEDKVHNFATLQCLCNIYLFWR